MENQIKFYDHSKVHQALEEDKHKAFIPYYNSF